LSFTERANEILCPGAGHIHHPVTQTKNKLNKYLIHTKKEMAKLQDTPGELGFSSSPDV